ncbi:MAG: CsgG/HfaB family protein [Spirochaetes bacterium]|nr:CsgG/HfaB family protein [Spirochaetota bacterium]
MKKIIVVVLLFFYFIPIYCQEALRRVGVLEFSANDVTESEARIIGELFTTELVATSLFEVVDRRNIEILLAEMEFQMSAVIDQSAAANIGRILSLGYIIYGSVSRLGESYIINVQLLNVETAQIEASARERFSKIEESYDVMNTIAVTLAGLMPLPRAQTNTTLPSPVTGTDMEGANSKLNMDLGLGIVVSEYTFGPEIEIGVRYAFNSRLSACAGILLGYDFDDDFIGFGLNLAAIYYFNELFGIGIGFKGLPTYIAAFGGPTLNVYFSSFLVRFGVDIIMGDGAVSLILGYTLQL